MTETHSSHRQDGVSSAQCFYKEKTEEEIIKEPTTKYDYGSVSGVVAKRYSEGELLKFYTWIKIRLQL